MHLPFPIKNTYLPFVSLYFLVSFYRIFFSSIYLHLNNELAFSAQSNGTLLKAVNRERVCLQYLPSHKGLLLKVLGVHN